METVKIYNSNDKLFGKLSNNSYHPITINGKNYSTITNYIFSNMLTKPSLKLILQYTEIKGSGGINPELMNAINQLIKIQQNEKDQSQEQLNSMNNIIYYLVKHTNKDKNYYDNIPAEDILTEYNTLIKEERKLKNKSIEKLTTEEKEEIDIQDSWFVLAQLNKQVDLKQKYINYITNKIREPFSSINLELLKQQLLEESELNKLDIYKTMDNAINQELRETLSLAVKKGFQQKMLDPIISNALLETGNLPIQYESTDQFLGIGIDGNGENIVGKTLMQIRHSIKIKNIEINKESKNIEINQQIYNTYLAYSILIEEIELNKNQLDEYLGLTSNQIINKYGISNITRGIPTQETIIQLYNNCKLNKIVMQEIFHPGTMVINIRKTGLGILQQSLIQDKNNIIFNYYLEYMITRNFKNEIDEETNKIHKTQNTKEKETIRKDIIDGILYKQLNIIPSEQLNVIKKKVINLFEYEMLSNSLSNKIESDIIKLNIPSNQVVETAEIAELPTSSLSEKEIECNSVNKNIYDKPLIENNEISNSLNSNESSGSQNSNNDNNDDNITTKNLKDLLKSKPKSKQLEDKQLEDKKLEDKQLEDKKLEDKKLEDKKLEDNQYTKPSGNPIGIFVDDNLNHPNIKNFNPFFYSGMLLIDDLYYPTIQHYIITQLIATTGTSRIIDNDGFVTFIKGMGIKNAHNYILLDENVDGHRFPLDGQRLGNNPEHYKNIELISRIYDEENKASNKILSSLLATTSLNKKFEDIELQKLLLLTGDSKIEWNSPYTKFNNIISGTKENPGGNYIGVILMNIREKLKQKEQLSIKKNVNNYNIVKFIDKDSFIKSWVEEKIKDMYGTVYKFQQYSKIKDNFDYTLEFETKLIQVINFVLNNIYYPCNSIDNKNNKHHLVPSFIIYSVKKCKGMSTGIQPTEILDSNGNIQYNKEIQNKISDNQKEISVLNSEFWDYKKTHSKEDSIEFEDYQRNEYVKYIHKLELKKLSTDKKYKKIKKFQNKQTLEYYTFWGIEKNIKTKDEISKHEYSIKQLQQELSKYIIESKKIDTHYNLIIKEISQLYFNRITNMLYLLINDLNITSEIKIREALIKIEKFSSEKKKRIKIISNPENNCIFLAIINLLSSILLYKKHFSTNQDLDTDDVNLARSIILNTPLEIHNKNDHKQMEIVIKEDGFFPGDDNKIVNDIEQELIDEEISNDIDNDQGIIDEEDFEDNPYYNFKWGVKTFNKKQNKNSITTEDIIKIKMQLILISQNKTQNFSDIISEIVNSIKLINISNISSKIKQNRINFFSNKNTNFFLN